MDSDDFIQYCLEYAEDAARVSRTSDDVAFEDAKSEMPADPTGELRTRILSDQGLYLPELPALVEASTGTDELVETTFEAVASLITVVDYEDEEVTEWSSIVDAYEQFLAVESIDGYWDRDCRRAAAELLWLMIGHSRSTFEATGHIELLVEAVLAFTDDPDPEIVPLDEDQLHTIRTVQGFRSSTAGVRAKGTPGLINTIG